LCACARPRRARASCHSVCVCVCVRAPTCPRRSSGATLAPPPPPTVAASTTGSRFSPPARRFLTASARPGSISPASCCGSRARHITWIRGTWAAGEKCASRSLPARNGREYRGHLSALMYCIISAKMFFSNLGRETNSVTIMIRMRTYLHIADCCPESRPSSLCRLADPAFWAGLKECAAFEMIHLHRRMCEQQLLMPYCFLFTPLSTK
jgi:hypothetical protein